MAKFPETRFKEVVLRELRQLPRTWVVKIQQVSINGTPDILACVNGVFVALELKRAKDAYLSELQRYELMRIKAANGVGFVTYPANWRRIYAKLAKLALRSIS